jgi:hypothetical protein
MQQKRFIVLAATALVALAVACGTNSSNQTSPTSPTASATGGDAAADGSTLKATAPTLVSPIGGTQLTQATPTFVWTAAAGKFVTGTTFTYRAQALTSTGVLIKETTTTGLTWSPTDQLDVSTTYMWKVRAEAGSYIGPWSATESFKSMDKLASYLKGSELYDDLTNGKTIGKISGPTHFIPGVGIMFDDTNAWVEYTMQAAPTQGEFSCLASGLEAKMPTEDPKSRVFGARDGWSAFNDNIYRMSVDKRGNGAMAWRFLTGTNAAGTYIETTGANERVVINMNPNLTYFYQATWKNNNFNVLLKQGGFNGTIVYNSGKPFKGTWNPPTPNMYLGHPWVAGDRGEYATAKGMVIRQVWISNNPRPGTINQ